MGRVVAVLHGHMIVIDHKHVSVPGRDLSILVVEEVESAVDNLIGRKDMVAVIQDIMQIHPSLLPSPCQMAQVVAYIVDLLFEIFYREPVEMFIKG